MILNYQLMDNRINLERQKIPVDQVTELILDNCRAAEVSGLNEDFINLEALSLINVGLVTLKGFPKLRKLRKLELNDNKLNGGLEFLHSCSSLQHLDLRGNRIVDFSTLEPLKEFPELTTLYLFNCKVSNLPNYRQKVFELISTLHSLDGYDRQGKVVCDGDEDEDELNNLNSPDAAVSEDERMEDDEHGKVVDIKPEERVTSNVEQNVAPQPQPMPQQQPPPPAQLVVDPPRVEARIEEKMEEVRPETRVEEKHQEDKSQETMVENLEVRMEEPTEEVVEEKVEEKMEVRSEEPAEGVVEEKVEEKVEESVEIRMEENVEVRMEEPVEEMVEPNHEVTEADNSGEKVLDAVPNLQPLGGIERNQLEVVDIGESDDEGSDQGHRIEREDNDELEDDEGEEEDEEESDYDEEDYDNGIGMPYDEDEGIIDGQDTDEEDHNEDEEDHDEDVDEEDDEYDEELGSVNEVMDARIRQAAENIAAAAAANAAARAARLENLGELDGDNDEEEGEDADDDVIEEVVEHGYDSKELQRSENSADDNFEHEPEMRDHETGTEDDAVLSSSGMNSSSETATTDSQRDESQGEGHEDGSSEEVSGAE